MGWRNPATVTEMGLSACKNWNREVLSLSVMQNLLVFQSRWLLQGKRKLKQSLVGHRSFMAAVGLTEKGVKWLLQTCSSSSQEWFHRWEGRKHLVKSTEVVGLEFHLRNQNKVSFHEGNGLPSFNSLFHTKVRQQESTFSSCIKQLANI